MNNMTGLKAPFLQSAHFTQPIGIIGRFWLLLFS